MNLNSQLDRCVRCGMCSQHCPTYTLTGDENESPRGRIALIRALDAGQIPPGGKLTKHLDHCTSCRACEDYCPSGVRFGSIMDATRTRLASEQTGPPSALLSLATRPRQLLRVGRWLRRYQRWGVQRLARASTLLKRLGLAQQDALLPELAELPPWQEYYPPTGEHCGDVALFTGCVSNVFDRRSLEASRRLLNHFGYGVRVPAAQTCCGAMHLHSGRADTAAELAQHNVAAFVPLIDSGSVQAIVHTASGCTAMLADYPHLSSLPADKHADAQRLADSTTDISQFLAACPQLTQQRPSPLPKTVAVHEPCSLRNVLHQQQAPYALLAHIPELQLRPLPTTTRCCGGAGSYLLTQPEFAQRMRQDQLDALRSLNADTLLTSNIGCALHLQAGLREQGQAVEVLHPVTLLARQLGLLD
ncbi:MAG: (Fe-S)-binding protein [Gammaproteobacteria bacterium]|nr:(Fe-S)-binding protein [Gammaproteobacteria bacterium]